MFGTTLVTSEKQMKSKPVLNSGQCHFGNKKSPNHWIKSQQNWTWIITIVWMTVANIWPPFGLYGFVCMFTPIILALSGWGKVSCARICPRGSFIGKFTRRISFGMKMPSCFCDEQKALCNRFFAHCFPESQNCGRALRRFKT